MSKTTSVVSGREIPKEFAGISGLSSGFNPSALSESRLVITGMPGAGKSTFLNSFPFLLMLDPERGGDTVADPRALRFTAPPELDIKDVPAAYEGMVDKTIASAKDSGFTMIGIDTIDEFIDVFAEAFCARHNIPDLLAYSGGDGNGYTIVRKQVFGLLDRVHRAGLGWAIIAHTTTKTVRSGGEEKEVTRLAVSDSFRAAIFKKCEHMLFIEHGVEEQTIPGKERTIKGKVIKGKDRKEYQKVRVLKTRPGGLFMGGDAQDVKVRVPLPERMVLPEVGGYEVFDAAYSVAVGNLTGENK